VVASRVDSIDPNFGGVNLITILVVFGIVILEIVLVDSKQIGIGKYALYESVKEFENVERDYINTKEQFYSKLSSEAKTHNRPGFREMRMMFEY